MTRLTRVAEKRYPAFFTLLFSAMVSFCFPNEVIPKRPRKKRGDCSVACPALDISHGGAAGPWTAVPEEKFYWFTG